jgi:transcriptional regulator GlxA family with amidase domain
MSMRTRPYRLAVIAFDEMDLLDVAGPLEVFSSAGRKWNWRAVKAELVASRPGPLSTRAQLGIGPASTLEVCPEPELVLIPGGYGARLALADASLLAYLERIRDGLTLALVVGSGALLAAKAGLLRETEVAATPALVDELRELDPSVKAKVDTRTVAGTRCISAAQNGGAIDLGLEAVARLLGKGQATGTARELGYPWGTETLTIEIRD